MNLVHHFCPACQCERLFVGRACPKCAWTVPPLVTHCSSKTFMLRQLPGSPRRGGKAPRSGFANGRKARSA